VAICLAVTDGIKIKEMASKFMSGMGDEGKQMADYFSGPGDEVGEFAFYTGPQGEGSLGFSDEWIVFTNSLKTMRADFADPPGRAADFESNVYLWANLDVLVHKVLAAMMEGEEMHGDEAAMFGALLESDADLGHVELIKKVSNGKIEAELTMNREVLTAYYQMMLGMVSMGIQEELGVQH
jgi:hypothetical protein